MPTAQIALTPPFNVVNYLTQRLKQLGVKHMFSVPGDYTSDFLAIVDEEQDPIQRIGNCNELNAGMAAYGYAMGKCANGGNAISCVSVTTGVGAASVLNAITAAYVEKVPIVLLIGTVSTVKLLSTINSGVLHHHTTGAPDENRHLFQNVTADFERISDRLTAPAQIDRALTTCISASMPVAIEIPEDIYYMPCAQPVGTLSSARQHTDYMTLQMMATTYGNKYAKQIIGAVSSSVSAAYNLLRSAISPVFWIGPEVARYGLQDKMLQILEITNANWASSLLGKGVLAETKPNFIGVHEGRFDRTETKDIINNSDCFIGIGTWNTDLNEMAPGPPMLPHIWAAKNVVKIVTPGGTVNNMLVSLENFLDGLYDMLLVSPFTKATPKKFDPVKHNYKPESRITYDSFGNTINRYLTTDHIVLGDIGLYTFGCVSYLDIKIQGGFICQSSWAHIGWSLPGSLGAGLGSNLRPVAILGDGSFKVTCQEISTIVEVGVPAVIFVLVNTVYGIEQMLEDTTPYEESSAVPFEDANILPGWDYISLMKGFSNNNPNALAITVNTVRDLTAAWDTINSNPYATCLIAVKIPMRDYPGAWGPLVSKNSQKTKKTNKG
jgi:indolepyruvate decarboxylase